MRRRYPATAIFQPRTDPAVLKFRKYLHLKKSAMHLLYSDKINPRTMRQPLKKFLKTNLLNFKSPKNFLASSTGYMCPHLRGITIEAEEREWYSACLRKKTRKLPNYLKRCKNLENLQIYQKLSPTLRSSLRYLHQLKSLVLVIYEIDMKVNPNMLRDLSYLREVSLKVKRDQQSLYQTLSITLPGELLFPRIFQQLMSLRYLTKIELDLEELSDPDNTQVIESVLSHLGVSNADFKIKLCLTNRVLDVEKIRKVLARTDTLVLQYQKKWQNDLEGHQKLEPERTRITRQGHRVLHFIHKEAGEVDFLRFIEECHELETLWIEAERSQSIVLRQFSFPKTLKNLFTVLPYLNTKMATTFLSYLIPALKNVKTVETLFFAVPVQESLSQIDKLKNFECIQNSTKYHLTVCFIPTSFIGQLYGNALISLCSPITTMSSLKSLRLDFERTLVAPVDCIQRVLDSLPKLQQFELVISAYNGPKTFDLYFPFESMSELTEFRLDLCNPLSTSAIYQFMKGFSKMKELEVMVIKGECFVDPEFKLQEIVDELVEMEKLRELWIGNKLLSLKGYQKIRKEEMGLKSYQINNRFRSW